MNDNRGFDDGDRLSWGITPFEQVGPAMFGARREDVGNALRSVIDLGYPQYLNDGVALYTAMRPGNAGLGPVVDFYFSDSDQLFAVALNAIRGPQVALEGVELTGRVPSELEADIGEYASRHGLLLAATLNGDIAVASLGVVFLAQRVGDAVLTRPVFVGGDWSDRFWDATESWIPAREWPQIY